ncbi:EF-hand calcium-binding domain-containing protein 4A [Nephila pilipes]|uniref:EF-hand calcium-binding domain-containing protein 4A n=1 Tax=Nephila pilipes TaxID=299642 RepID=A0A8X6URG3_NEPPI|nr:EF-hand calcium-binding domain-containing protein 4A [Nephila pilipes]
MINWFDVQLLHVELKIGKLLRLLAPSLCSTENSCKKILIIFLNLTKSAAMMRDRGDLRETLQNKARDLFALCDPEGKGYATKTDIEALRDEVPLPSSQLHQVFDALDANGDGKLTLKEFTDGFGIFLGIDTLPSNNSNFQDGIEVEDDDEMLEELLDHLGARNLFTE